MWHEARRQERKIRGMLVDYRKRAERRRDFYEKIKADPTQFLQIHGRQCKIHLDPAIAAAADSTVMMPWQGQSDNLIDRFDVRAHLDHIPPIKKEDLSELSQEERQLNYERYRIIAQNAYLSISEEKFLRQLYLEEQFGYTDTKGKKESKGTGAAIGFNYEEGIAIPGPTQEVREDNSDEDNSDSDLDVDLAINVSKIDSTQAHEMNKHGQHFGMSGNDFYSFLTNDLEEAESYKLAKEEEHEKALFSGRKSRRERRAHREKRLANRKISPPSYAAKEFPINQALRDESKSPSRSPSPDAGKITYITSFGDDEEPPAKPTYADKVKYGKPRKGDANSERHSYLVKRDNQSNSKNSFYNRKRRSESKSRQVKSRSRSRLSRSRDRMPIRSRSNSRSRLRRPRRTLSRDRNASHLARYKRRLTRSRSRSRSVKIRRSRSRSPTKRNSPRRSRSRSRPRRRGDTRSHSNSRSRKSRSRSIGPSVSFHHRSPSSSSLSSSSSSAKSNINNTQSPSSRSSKSKSKSKTPVPPSPPKIVPRYYGRKRSDESSSKSSSSEDEDNQDYSKPVNLEATDSKFGTGNNSGIVSKKSSTLTIIERLKRRRQAAINKQYIKDKIAEVQKLEREKQEQQTREDELREMAIKLRRRQREKRHAYDRSSSSDSEKSSTSRNRESRSPRSRDRDSNRSDRERRTRDRKSRSRERSRRSPSRERHRERRSRSRSRSRRRERERDRDSKRDRDEGHKEVKKLVDY